MPPHSGPPRIILVGQPNVGKSLLFNRLTGRTAIVSNYPGTTVEIDRGIVSIDARRYELIDTPGLYSLIPVTEEERITRRILLFEDPFLVIHVVDAKNLERMLPLTLQLIEAGIPAVLVLNMIDEAERAGIRIDVKALQDELRIPVVATACTSGRGIDRLKSILSSWSEVAAV